MLNSHGILESSFGARAREFATRTTVFGRVTGLLDHYLAHKAFEGQMMDEPETSRPDDLFEPVEGDRGAHGRVDEKATDSRVVTAASAAMGAGGVRAATVLTAVATIAGAALLTRRLSSTRA